MSWREVFFDCEGEGLEMKFCPICKKGVMHKHGLYFSKKAGSHQRFKCQKCGSVLKKEFGGERVEV